MPVPKGAGLGKADNSYFCVGHPEKRSLNGGKKMKNKNLMRFTTTALLFALIVVFGLTPLGFINVGVVYITFLCIPVIIGTLAMGLHQGIFLCLGMAGVSLYKAITATSALVAPLMQDSLGWVIALCLFPRIMVPVVTNGVHRLLKMKNEKLSFAVSAAAGSLTNTILYLGLMLVFYVLVGLENPTLLGTVGTIALTAGLPEAAAAAIITAPVLMALKKAGLLKHL